MNAPEDNQSIVGFGAGAWDLYMPMGYTSPDHTPGAKIVMSDKDESSIQAILADPDVEHHVGGNVMNTLAYLAASTRHQVEFAGVLGVKDRASEHIRNHLGYLGIHNQAITVPGYLPSVSLIERAYPGSDRMVRGRPRHAQSEYISDSFIKDRVQNAGIVVAASLKDLNLSQRIFAATPEDKFLSYNPGSSEFTTEPESLLDLMQDRQPTLLALNDEELRRLFGDHETDIHQLAARASSLSQFVLCTMGKQGSLIASNGDTVHGAAQIVAAEKVVDTLGAGDRAHAVAISGLAQGFAPEQILREIALQTASTVQAIGAHGDLYDKTPVLSRK